MCIIYASPTYCLNSSVSLSVYLSRCLPVYLAAISLSLCLSVSRSRSRTPSGNTNEMQGLANKCTEGDMTQLVNSMNDFFVSVSADLPRLDPTHRVFDIEEPLPAEFTIEAASTHSSVDGEKLCTPFSCARHGYFQ